MPVRGNGIPGSWISGVTGFSNQPSRAETLIGAMVAPALVAVLFAALAVCASVIKRLTRFFEKYGPTIVRVLKMMQSLLEIARKAKAMMNVGAGIMMAGPLLNLEGKTPMLIPLPLYRQRTTHSLPGACLHLESNGETPCSSSGRSKRERRFCFTAR